MAKWIEVSAKSESITDNGKLKKVTEKYLVDALTMTEAETRITDVLKTRGGEDFNVDASKTTKISEVFGLYKDGSDRWYLAKIAFISIDEKTGKDKKNISQILVKGGSFESALEAVNEGMKGTLSDWDIVSLAETTFLDVIPYQAKE